VRRSALDTATSDVGPSELDTSCVVYCQLAEGVRMPERPTRKLAPMRGAMAKPVPRSSMYEAPKPRPRKPKVMRLNGMW